MGKCTIHDKYSGDETVVRMCDMKPLQVGVIIESGVIEDIDCYVLRTASSNMEIINLSKWKNDRWSSISPIMVKLCSAPLTITIEN